MHAKELRISSQEQAALLLPSICGAKVDVDAQDVAALWGDRLPSTSAEAGRATQVVEALLASVPSAPGCVRRFCEEDCRRRKAALACSCLASGDVDAGAKLVQGLLAARPQGSANAPKNLGELLGAGMLGGF